MSLRWKTQILVLIVWVGFTVPGVLVHQWVILPRFQEVEADAVRADLERCSDALQFEARQLEYLAADYADRDEMHCYLESHDPEFIHASFSPATLNNLELEFVAILDHEAKVVWGQLNLHGALVHEGQEILDGLALPSNATDLLDPTAMGASGVLITEHGPVLLGTHRIHDTSQSEMYGLVLVGRFLDGPRAAELSERTHVTCQVSELASLPESQRRLYDGLGSAPRAWRVERDGATAAGYGVLADMLGRPALALRTTLPRDIYRQGLVAAHAGSLVTLLTGVAMLLTMWHALSALVVNPLSRLTRHAMHVGRSGDLSARLNLKTQDEVGTLAGELDRMVSQLESLQSTMVSVARSAGMAEVASSVLHNVGNVLNSVNIAAGSVQSKLRESEVATLRRAAGLLHERRDDLPAFLTADERGRRLPAFLVELAQCLEREQEAMQGDMAHLTDAVEHLRRIVRDQQDYRSAPQAALRVSPTNLVEKALALSAESFGRHGIRVTRHFERRDAVRLDQHRALQIIVNLISNARQAIKAAQPAEPEITVTVRDVDAQRFRILVTDNGVGIPPENLTRVFSLGFTTKADGQGIGLHTSALMAREMGGTLFAESPGRGRGATFVLELPVDAPSDARPAAPAAGAQAPELEDANP